MAQEIKSNEKLLHKISYLIASDISIKEAADIIANLLCDHLRVDRCIIHDYNDGKSSFVSENYIKSYKSMIDGDDSLNSLVKYIKFQNDLFNKKSDGLKNNKALICPNITYDSDCLRMKDLYGEFSIASEISIIVTFNNQINGGLYIHQSSPRKWLKQEVRFLEMVAEQFALVIDRSYSLDKVMIANQKLMQKTLELKKALKEERRMRKMQSEFVAMVSHEFKTPLQIIDGAREVLGRKIKPFLDKDIALEKYLARIKSGIKRMNGLIQSTLDLSKVEMDAKSIKINRQDFNIKNLINEILERKTDLILEKNINPIIQIGQLPQIYNGDAKLLDHCISNVITNAIKYSKNSSIIEIIGSQEGGYLKIKIIDNGIGIPKNDISKIGNKFFRAKNAIFVSGTGIGLYLTKYFVELHNGSVLIESQLNAGTSVTISLPI